MHRTKGKGSVLLGEKADVQKTANCEGVARIKGRHSLVARWKCSVEVSELSAPSLGYTTAACNRAGGGVCDKAELEVTSSVVHAAVCFREILKWRSCVTPPVRLKPRSRQNTQT